MQEKLSENTMDTRGKSEITSLESQGFPAY